MRDLATVEFERRGPVLIAVVAGEIDVTNAIAVERRVLGAIEPADGAVVLALDGLRYADSAGIRSLFELHAAVTEHRRRLRIVADSSSMIGRLLHRTGVVASLPVDDDLDAALRAAAPTSS